LEFRRYYEGEEEWKKNGIGTQRTILIETWKLENGFSKECENRGNERLTRLRGKFKYTFHIKQPNNYFLWWTLCTRLIWPVFFFLGNFWRESLFWQLFNCRTIFICAFIYFFNFLLHPGLCALWVSCPLVIHFKLSK
jgi:hypothetical protein